MPMPSRAACAKAHRSRAQARCSTGSFATRTYGLMDKLPATALADYLSGLLIGAEVAEATRQTTSAMTIIASPALAQRYTDALRLLGHDSALAPAGLRRGGPLAHCARRRSVLRRRDARPARRTCPMPDRRDPARREAGRDRRHRRCADRGRHHGHRGAAEFPAAVREHQEARRAPRAPRARRRRHGADGRRCCAREGCRRQTDRRAEFRCRCRARRQGGGPRGAARRDDAVRRFRGAEGGRRRAEAVSRPRSSRPPCSRRGARCSRPTR